MSIIKLSSLALIGVFVCLLCAKTASSACADPAIEFLTIYTNENEYLKASTVNLQAITVRTAGNIGQFIATGVETITASASAGFTLTGTLTRTTTAGAVTFNDLALVDPVKGITYIHFTLCGGVKVVDLEIVIQSGAAAKIIWVRQPELSITNFGYVPVKPEMGYADVNGYITDMVGLGTWKLKINDTMVTLANNQVTPTSTSGNVVTFSTLRFEGVTAAMNGRVFELSLESIGAVTEGTSTIPFPPKLLVKVADCARTFQIIPADPAASLEYFYVKATGGLTWVPLKGWNLLSELSTVGKCKFNGLVYPMAFYDVCNIACQLPAIIGTRDVLQVTLNGFGYMNVSNVSFIGSRRILVADKTNVVLYREDVVYSRFSLKVVDEYGNYVFRHIPNAPPRYVFCQTTSPFARQKWVTYEFLNPKKNLVETPAFRPALVDSTATLEMAFANNLEVDYHIFTCNATGVEPVTLNITIIEECTSPPFITSVRAPGCVVNATTQDLQLCRTTGSIPITISGGGFGFSGAEVRVGSQMCTSVVHSPTAKTRILIATGCAGTGVNKSVVVYRPEGVYAEWNHRYSFARPPAITSIVGCEYNFYPSTANCRLDGSSMVRIEGSDFGASGAKVYFYYQVPPGAVTRIQALTVIHNDAAGTSLNATGFSGSGQRFDVAVETVGGEITREKYVTMSFIDSIYVACPSYNGQQCNSKGNCNTNIGTCVCFDDDTNGHWIGSACDRCASSYYGSSCASRCPGGSTTCSGISRGTCSDGTTGSGLCSCISGFGGLACEQICPGGVSSPCLGRGACVQGVPTTYCNCTQSASQGYYSGTQCESCSFPYIGTACTLRCPVHYLTPTQVCSGKGVCQPTSSAAICTCQTDYCGASCEFTGADCGTCPIGKYGSGCAFTCPGYDAAGPTACSGHGTCDGGTQGSGMCVCNAGWAFSDCSGQCPIYNSVICAGHGECSSSTAQCSCASGYATSNCARACPGLGTANGVCSSHGSCSEGASGTGVCTCNLGYAGENCDLTCAGGASSPCTFHGLCQSDASCRCHNTSILGYWTGADCSSCVTGFYGQYCNGTCPKTNGLQCAGHGECTYSVTCSCNDNAIQGYWAEPNCSACKPNYYGAQCTLQCPGGACFACSFHGDCSDGISGTGLCTCYSNSTTGYWTGARCGDCTANYYGTQCKSFCPNVGGVVCNGKGRCSDGVRGNGTCDCIQDPVLRFLGRYVLLSLQIRILWTFLCTQMPGSVCGV